MAVYALDYENPRIAAAMKELGIKNEELIYK
jgi:hypothetical protein